MSQNTIKPKISIVIPSFNQGEYLRQAIESVILQEYSSLELLVFDGQSSDQSVEIIQEYSPHIQTWVSQVDRGQGDAINQGFRKATGDLVAWLNADDYYLPHAFEQVAETYSTNPDAPFYFGDGFRVDKAGNITAKYFPEGSLRFDRQALILGLNYILQPSTFIRRDALEHIGYLDITLNYGMDSDLWMRLSHLGSPVAVNFPLSATREYETTKTATGSFERVEELRRIAMRYSGLSMTPGTICYFLDTLYKFIQDHEDVYPPHYSTAVVDFWEKTFALFDIFNAEPSGFPKAQKNDLPLMENDEQV